MKKILILVLYFIAFTTFAQNWAPINATERFCYSADNNLQMIDNVLWVDSLSLIGDEQVFHLNKIARPIENPNLIMYLYNEPQFLLDDVQVHSNGEWVFVDTSVTDLDPLESFTLIPQANMYDSWEFSDNMIAVVANVSTMYLFGAVDSVKTILLSDYSQILLSKNHGIVNWRDQYELIGIEGRNLGVLVPDFDDLYVNISAGDVVCLYSYGWTVESKYVETWIQTRYNIENVTRYQDSIVLNVFAITNSHSTGWLPKSSDYQFGYHEIVFHRSSLTDLYPNQLIYLSLMENNAMGSGYAIGKLEEFKWGGLKKTQVTYDSYYLNSNLFQVYNGPYNYQLCELSDETALIEQSVKYGFMEYENIGFEWGGSKELIGVIDNGDTLGTIYPLEMFVGTNTPNLATDWNIFPNPAQDFIQLKNFSSANDIQVIISDINGNIILQQLIKPEDKIDLSPLSSGIYIAEIFDGDKSARKKLIKL